MLKHLHHLYENKQHLEDMYEFFQIGLRKIEFVTRLKLTPNLSQSFEISRANFWEISKKAAPRPKLFNCAA